MLEFTLIPIIIIISIQKRRYTETRSFDLMLDKMAQHFFMFVVLLNNKAQEKRAYGKFGVINSS